MRVGGGVKVFGNEAVSGLAFNFSAGLSNVHSDSHGFTYTGAVDNLPKQAQGYGFSWNLAVNASHKDMPTDGDEPTENQFWIVGYEVSDVTRPAVGAVSGLAATGSTDSSVTLSWDDVLQPDSGYNYAVSMLNSNGQTGD